MTTNNSQFYGNVLRGRSKRRLILSDTRKKEDLIETPFASGKADEKIISIEISPSSETKWQALKMPSRRIVRRQISKRRDLIRNKDDMFSNLFGEWKANKEVKF